MASTAARLCLSEILWFFHNNLNNLDNEKFTNTISEFYNSDEINIGKKLLLNELELLKKDKIKMAARGHTKFDRVCDITELWKYAIEHGLVSTLPMFVIQSYSRIPSYFPSVTSGNMTEEIAKVINNKFDLKFEKFDKVFSNNQVQLIQLQNSIQQLLVQVQDKITNFSAGLPAQQQQQQSMQFNTSTQSKSYVDTVKSTIISDTGNEISKNLNIVNKMKIFGNKNINKKFNIKAAKLFVRKSYFYVGNLNECTKEDIEQHLTDMDIKFISVQPVFNKIKQSKNMTNSDPSSAFRVCVLEEEVHNLLNEESWPEAVYIQKWVFTDYNNKDNNNINNPVNKNGV